MLPVILILMAVELAHIGFYFVAFCMCVVAIVSIRWVRAAIFWVWMVRMIRR